MSLFSLADLRTIGEYSWRVYKACKAASTEFEEISGEVLALHTVLQELRDATEDPSSLIGRAADSRKLELSKIMPSCQRILTHIDNLVNRYHSLGTDKKRKWDIIRFGSEELGLLRTKLILSVSNLNLFLNSLETTSLARIESLLEKLLQEVRVGRRAPTVLSSVIENAAEGWPQLKTQLTDEGVSKADIEMYKGSIQAWIKEVDQIGIFDEMEPGTDLTPIRVKLRQLSVGAPPSSTVSAGDLTISQPPSQNTTHPPSVVEAAADERFDEDRIAANIQFSTPLQLRPLSLRQLVASSNKSSDSINSIPLSGENSGPETRVGAHAQTDPALLGGAETSKASTAVSENLNEVISHTVPPESLSPLSHSLALSPLSPKLEKRPIPEQPSLSKKTSNDEGYISIEPMSPSEPVPNKKPLPSPSNDIGREEAAPGGLLACWARCHDDPYDSRYLIDEEMRTVS